ncbi:hypothetical protein ABZ845_04525 [Streptomyces sp. NPDC047022]|uniref:hypothetical protein n=1 Tax=Streptomyces sp. NPDC047022 TaxID=3155737 RepID=UPI0033DB1D97
MKIFASRRRRRVGWAVGGLLLVLAVTAQVLYSTGIYASWRDGRSLDSACDGTLAQAGLEAALNSSQPRARAYDDSDYLTGCSVHSSVSGRQKSYLVLRLRWSTAAPPSGDLAYYGLGYNGVTNQAAPLGHGWPGIVRYDGGVYGVVVALDCENQKSKALVAYGELFGKSNSTTLGGLGRVTAESAKKAAEKYGCHVRALGKQVTGLSSARLGTPDTAKPLGQAQGSCLALRGTAAAQNGTPDVMEYPADPDAPQTNCYLVTEAKKPGYGLYGYYGAIAKEFMTGKGDDLTFEGHDYSWATATCPQSAQPAVFVLYHLWDDPTDTYPVAHYSASFANSALKAFAEHEAKQRGCTNVRMMSGA